MTPRKRRSDLLAPVSTSLDGIIEIRNFFAVLHNMHERLSALRKEHEIQMKSQKMQHEDDYRKLQEELELKKSKGLRFPMAAATIERMATEAIVEKEKAVKFTARAVVTVRRKRREDLKETIANQIDAYSDKIVGRSVLLELIGTEIDPSWS